MQHARRKAAKSRVRSQKEKQLQQLQQRNTKTKTRTRELDVEMESMETTADEEWQSFEDVLREVKLELAGYQPS